MHIYNILCDNWGDIVILDLKKAFITNDYVAPVEYELDLQDIEYSGVFPLKQPISVKGEVANSAGVVTLSIHYSVRYEAPCDRCGRDAVEEIGVDITHVLATSIENEDNDDIVLVPEMELDLDELCRNDVLLHIPMKHLCRKNCKGMCSVCGKNLNDGECDCIKKEIDPRLQALADLLN